MRTGWDVCAMHIASHRPDEVLGDERAATLAGFLRRAIAFFARYGIRVERVLTDNGSA